MSDENLTPRPEDFSPGSRRQGDAYLRQGRVEIEKRTDTLVIAQVRGTRRYDVVIEHLEGDVTAYRCNCSVAERDGECKHIWATIQKANAAIDPASRTWAPRRGPIPIPGASSRTALSTERTDQDWRTYLDRLHRLVGVDRGPRWPRSVTGEVQLLFWLTSARLDRAIGDPAILVAERRSTKAGWGEPRAFQLNDRSLEQVIGGNELRLLELLLPFTSGTSPWAARPRQFSQAPISLPGLAGTEVLRELAAAGRLFLREQVPEEFPPLVFEGGPWRFSFRLVKKDTKGSDRRGVGEKYTLAASFRSGDEQVALDEPNLITPSGLICIHGKLAPYERVEDGAWIRALSMSPPTIPAKDVHDFCRKIVEENPDAPFELADGVEIELHRPAPRPHLVVRQEKGTRRGSTALVCTLTFEYGEGLTVSPDDEAETVLDGETMVARNRETERKAVADLIGLGARRNASHETLEGMTVPASRLSQMVETLLSRDWTVTAEGRVHRVASAFDIRVKSGIDWLDLSGSVQFEGETVPFPRLLAAVRGGNRRITLGDGSYGVLPEDWLRRSGLLAQFGEVEDDEVRFRPNQAWILDALLEGIPDVQVDADFARLRDRLRAFEGIEPRMELPSFHGELRPYQRDALGWLAFLREYSLGGCLADDMGLGKTVQVIAHFEDLRVSGDLTKPVLVVAPRSIVEHWRRETVRFAPGLKVIDASGPDREALREEIPKSHIVLITYAILRLDIRLLREIDFDSVVLDEAQAIKNARSQTAKAARLVVADHRLALSGTPIENHLGELWSLFEFLQPGMLGRASRFGKLTAGGLDGEAPGVDESADDDDEEEGADASDATTAAEDAEVIVKDVIPDARRRHSGLDLLARAVRPFILRRTKGQVATDLPERTELTILCDLEPEQRKLYDELAEHYRASLLPQVRDGAIGSMKMQVIQALLRLRQAACHPGLLDESRKSETSGKLETVVERIIELEDEGHRCLVFSQFTTFLGIVRDRLDEKKISYEYLDGRTRNRQERIDRFQLEGHGTAFLISLKAGGLGLNLTAADYVFILDPWWNPASEAQAIDRAHRIGQTQHVFAYRLIAPGTVEEKIVALQERKRALADAIIRADDGLVKTLTADDLEFILSVG